MATRKVNKILTAVVRGASDSETNLDVRLAAMQALHNALQFAGPNFRIKQERDFVMHIVGAATACADARVGLLLHKRNPNS